MISLNKSDRKMKSRLITVLIALVVALTAAGGSYGKSASIKTGVNSILYTKGVDALIYAFLMFEHSASLQVGSA